MQFCSEVKPMQSVTHIPTPEAILARAARIGLPVSRLAAQAGLKPSTASRWKSKANGSTAGSLKKMADQLELREREMLAYLLAMYPDQTACGKTSEPARKPHAERQVSNQTSKRTG
jgi:transcriptional regulator with XRE-family HTH domain